MFGLYGHSGGKHMAETLQAFCYDCQATVEVHGYFAGIDEDGRNQWELTEPPDADAPDHHHHDVSIEGQA
jgi:hypothetical protein